MGEVVELEIVSLDELDTDVALDRGVHEQVVSRLETARLRRAVRTLPELERRVICWRYGLLGEELSTRQVARRLNMSPSHVWKLQQQALGRLRHSYGIARERAVLREAA